MIMYIFVSFSKSQLFLDQSHRNDRMFNFIHTTAASFSGQGKANPPISELTIVLHAQTHRAGTESGTGHVLDPEDYGKRRIKWQNPNRPGESETHAFVPTREVYSELLEKLKGGAVTYDGTEYEPETVARELANEMREHKWSINDRPERKVTDSEGTELVMVYVPTLPSTA